MQLLLVNSTLPNLFDNHSPFQNDGNYGFTPGIAEMLMQSYEGVLRLLPALPPDRNSGSICGLRVRGGYTVDAAWENSALTEARITADYEGALRICNGGVFAHHSGDKMVIGRYA